MNKNKILIAVGSRFGCTEEISQKMNEWLSAKNYDVDVVNLKENGWKTAFPLSDYQSIIIGTGIKMGRWTKEVKNFIKDNIDYFKSCPSKISIFVSSGDAAFTETYEKAKKDFLFVPITEFGLNCKESAIFGGVLDFTKTSNIGWLDKKVMAAVLKGNNQVDLRGRNDFRNWNQIKIFTNNAISDQEVSLL